MQESNEQINKLFKEEDPTRIQNNLTMISKSEEILKIAINRAHESIKHFLKLLNLDSEIFEHLFDFDIKVDYEKLHIDNDTCAIFRLNNDKEGNNIYIGYDYISSKIKEFEEGNISKQDVVNDLSITIIHEILHANRSIIIGSEDQEELDLLGHNREFYDEILIDYINSGVDTIYSRYVPLYVYSSMLNIFDVVVYDKVNKSYDLYRNLEFDSNNKYPTIGLYMNSEEFELMPDEVHPYEDINELKYINDPAVVYHQNNKTISEEQQSHIIDLQNKFEEILVEGLATIILFTRKTSNLDLNRFYENYFEVYKDDIRSENMLGIKLLCAFGLDGIKWFIMSSYGEVYEDRLFNTFKEKYYKLLESFRVLIDMESSKTEEMKSMYYIDSIIDEKLVK